MTINNYICIDNDIENQQYNFYEVNENSSTYISTKSHVLSFAKLAIPVILSIYTPAIQGVIRPNENDLIRTQEYSVNLGTYTNGDIEIKDIDMTNIEKTISNTKDIEYIKESIDYIKQNMVTKEAHDKDLKNVKLSMRNWVLSGIIVTLLSVIGIIATIGKDIVTQAITAVLLGN